MFEMYGILVRKTAELFGSTLTRSATFPSVIQSESFLVGKWNHKENSLSMQMISNDHPSHKGCNSFDASLEGHKTLPMFEAILTYRSDPNPGNLRPGDRKLATGRVMLHDCCGMNSAVLRVQADCIWLHTTRASSFSETYMSTWILQE